MIKWIVSDLDGTLLGYDPKKGGIIVDPKTFESLNALLASDQYKMTIATGRHFTNVQGMMKTFKLNYPADAFIVGMNGAQIYSCKDKKLIVNSFIENSSLLYFYDVIEYFEREYKDRYFMFGYQDSEYHMFFYNSKSQYFKDCVDLIRKYEDKEKLLKSCTINKLDNIENVYKIVFSIDPPFDYNEILTMLKKTIPNMNFALSSDRTIEAFPKTVNKAIAIDYINNNYYNFDRNEIIAFGDSFNDYEMLEYAGTSVTKTSSHNDIKKICDYIIDADSSTFVGDAIELLLGK